MFGPIEPGRSRWLRLRPADPVDFGLFVLMVLGLGLYLASQSAARPDMPWPWIQVVVDVAFMVHGSTPVLFFLATTAYLLRWGRAIGRNKAWVVAGLVLTVPLWFLVGLPVAVRGVGDVTVYTIAWNLLALGVMVAGVWRTLHTSSRQEPALDS